MRWLDVLVDLYIKIRSSLNIWYFEAQTIFKVLQADQYFGFIIIDTENFALHKQAVQDTEEYRGPFCNYWNFCANPKLNSCSVFFFLHDTKVTNSNSKL